MSSFAPDPLLASLSSGTPGVSGFSPTQTMRLWQQAIGADDVELVEAFLAQSIVPPPPRPGEVGWMGQVLASKAWRVLDVLSKSPALVASLGETVRQDVLCWWHPPRDLACLTPALPGLLAMTPSGVVCDAEGRTFLHMLFSCTLEFHQREQFVACLTRWVSLPGFLPALDKKDETGRTPVDCLAHHVHSLDNQPVQAWFEQFRLNNLPGALSPARPLRL
jgi:hypothetical protein